VGLEGLEAGAYKRGDGGERGQIKIRKINYANTRKARKKNKNTWKREMKGKNNDPLPK